MCVCDIRIVEQATKRVVLVIFSSELDMSLIDIIQVQLSG